MNPADIILAQYHATVVHRQAVVIEILRQEITELREALAASEQSHETLTARYIAEAVG